MSTPPYEFSRSSAARSAPSQPVGSPSWTPATLSATRSSRGSPRAPYGRNKIAHLNARIVATLGASSLWRSAVGLKSYLARCYLLDSKEHYAYYFREAEYSEGILFLANALECVRSGVRAAPELMTVLRSVGFFWDRFQAEICKDGLQAPLIYAWNEMMRVFDGTMVSIPEMGGSPSAGIIVNGSAAQDIALEWLPASCFNPDDELTIVVQDWLKPCRCASHSTTVLDLLLRVREGRSGLSIYFSRYLKSAATDRLVWGPLIAAAVPYLVKRYNDNLIRRLIAKFELSAHARP